MLIKMIRYQNSDRLQSTHNHCFRIVEHIRSHMYEINLKFNSCDNFLTLRHQSRRAPNMENWRLLMLVNHQLRSRKAVFFLGIHQCQSYPSVNAQFPQLGFIIGAFHRQCFVLFNCSCLILLSFIPLRGAHFRAPKILGIKDSNST